LKKKSIIYAIDDVNYNGGAHVATYNQIEYLTSTGIYDISILSLADPDDALKNRFPGVKFYCVVSDDNKVDRDLYNTGLKFVLKSGSYSAAQKIKRIYMSVSRKISGADKVEERYMSFENPALQIINLHDIVCVPFENSVFRHIAAKSKCKEKIQWIHIEYAYWISLNDTTKKVSQNDRELYGRFDKIVFVSHAGMKGFVDLYPELRGKCSVCYNLLDDKGIRALSDGGAKGFDGDGDCLQIVTVARLEDCQKAIRRSLDVALRLKNDGRRFKWYFVGGGCDEDMLHEYAGRLQIEDKVIWIGQVANPYAYVARADLFALFSYYEGIPNTIFESFIIGTPVIATAVSGIPEQIDEANGWLVENNEDSIYEGMSYLFDNKNEVTEKRVNLKKYRYDNDGIKRRLVEIFNLKAEG